ncbi:STAS-like domain-containing protein (plasmid) [Leptospira sp. WS92.C1]
MVIYLKDYIQSGSSYRDGEIIYKLLIHNFPINEKIIISFKDFGAVSSSFVNVAFVQLLENFSFDEIRKKLNFIDTLKVHTNLIKDRFEFETNVRVK